VRVTRALVPKWLNATQQVGVRMAEDGRIAGRLARENAYRRLLMDLDDALGDEHDLVANMALTVSVVFHGLPYLNWVGFYRCRDGELVIGPFQGQRAKVRIPMGNGACGKVALKKRTIVVEDVHRFPGLVSWAPGCASEIVLPLVKHGRLFAVLELDSPVPSRFEQVDQDGLEALIKEFIQRTDVEAR